MSSAAPSVLSPAAEAARRSLLSLPAPDRAAVLASLPESATPPAEEFGEAPNVPVSVLRELERDADEIDRGLQRTYSWEEVEEELDRFMEMPADQLPPSYRAAFEAGRAAAVAAGEEPGA